MNAPTPAIEVPASGRGDDPLRLVLPVGGMTCAACALRLERVLGRVEGVTSASVSFASERVTVALGPGASRLTDIVQAIERAGFSVPPATARLRIGGMTCATCSGRVETVLRRVPGVISAQVNLASELATVAYTPGGVALTELVDAVRRTGYRVAVAESAAAEREAAERVDAARSRRELGWLVVLGGLTVPLVAPMVLMPFGMEWMLPGWVQLVLALPVQVLGGARFYRGAWSALRGRSANMDVLVSVGTSAAFLLSLALLAGGGHLYFEAAAAVIVFIRLGKWLESRAKRGTTRAIRALMALRPVMARVRRGEREIEVPVDAVGRGELVVVRPGERVPVDGRITAGESELDESLLTGESIPSAKGVGDDVTGGSINGEGLLVVEATRVGEESTLSRIVGLVEDAQASKAPIQHAVDKVAAVFVPAVLAVSVLTLGFWFASGAGVELAIIRAVSVLVIACPCALGLATPAALIVGTGAAARTGILIRDAEALQRTHSVTTVVFDKTGTLTEGRPEVLGILADDEPRVLRLAAAAQHGSEHPLAHAVRRSLRERGLEASPASDFRVLRGQGVEARVLGHTITVGSPRLMAERGIELGAFDARAHQLEAQGMTVVWVVDDGNLVGGLAIGDAPRATAAHAVRRLKALGVQAVMLTGDNRRAAEAVAALLGIARVIAEVLPEEKVRVLEALRREGGAVAMVGDGINDAPALAVADVGIAMGTGTDVAMHTAGVTLMRAELGLVADAIGISRATTRKIHQNLFWAFLYNMVGIPLAAWGLLTPMVAGAAMALSSVSVVTNALLLRRWRPNR